MLVRNYRKKMFLIVGFCREQVHGFFIYNFVAEGKKVKEWLEMEGVGGVGLGRWAGRYS